MNVSLFSQKNNCEKLADLEYRINRLTKSTSFVQLGKTALNSMFRKTAKNTELPPDPPPVKPSFLTRLFTNTSNNPNVSDITNPKTGGNKSMKYRKNRNKKTKRRRN